MAAFNKFEIASENLAEGVHTLDAAGDVIKIYLSNTAPNAATHTAYDGVTGSTGPAEIAAGNGYTAGGIDVTNDTSRAGGTTSVISADTVMWTASGGSIGPLRYAIIYNDTASPKSLIGWWDYGSAITANAGETFTVDFGSSLFTVA